MTDKKFAKKLEAAINGVKAVLYKYNPDNESFVLRIDKTPDGVIYVSTNNAYWGADANKRFYFDWENGKLVRDSFKKEED